MGDSLISGSGDSIAFVSDQHGKGFGVSVFGEGESIYLRIEIKKAPGEFTDDVDIFDGDRTFSGATLSSNRYGDQIQDIYFTM